MAVLRGCVHKVNKRGPRTEPCGTPHFKRIKLIRDLQKTRPRKLRLEVNQPRTVPEQPKVVCNLLIKMTWSMLSKAADRSGSDKVDTWPLLEA